MMQLYPALDLINGQCVRLRQGDFGQRTEYAINPVEQARSYQRQGADWLHLVDLDGARLGHPVHLKLLQQMANHGLNIQTGGGIRNHEHLEQLFEAGATRVVIGSLAVKEPLQVQSWLQEFGPERITLAFDVRLDGAGVPRLATAAWQKTETITLDEITEQYLPLGLKHVLCTDIGRDGELAGPSLELYRAYKQRFPQIQLQASGGIHALDDLTALQAAGVDGAVMGKSLLDGLFTVEEALQCLRDG